MKRLLKLLFIMVLPSLLLAAEQKKGSVSVLLFSEGKPLVSNEIKLDGQKIYMTDKDGSIQVPLIVGKHQVEIYGKDATGAHLGYFKKQIMIKEGKDTQVIATLSKIGADNIDIDTPVAMTTLKNKEVKQSTGTGRLSGTVLSSERGKPIAGARVFVRGTDIDTRTDAKGRFVVKVPAGINLSISVVHSAYSAQTIGNIRVSKDGGTSRTIKLTPASMELEEFVVLAPKVEGSIADVIEEEKQSNAIANILGSEEFSKKGDSSAASALKRVTGVTLIGGKSIFVRGLGERYSNVELNSLPLASPNPTQRVVPLDIFPSSMIGSMKVQKSATADIPSNFGGGYIDLRTRDKYEEDYIKISFGLKGNSNTGRDVVSHQGSDTDWLGFDDGYRDIPSVILDHTAVNVGERIGVFSTNTFSKEELMQLTKDFVTRNYAITKEALPLGGSFSIEGLKNFDINDEHKITVFGNYTYKAEHEYKEEQFFKYRYDSEGNQADTPESDGTTINASSTYSHGAMLNVNYSFADVLKVKYTKLFTHVGEKNTRVTEGRFGSDLDNLIYHYLDWSERTLNVDQLVGDFDYELFNRKNTFNFGLEYVTALLDQPNNFFYADKLLDSGDKVILSGQTNFLSKKINSEDDVSAFYLNNKVDYGFFSDDDYMQVGLSYSAKNRVSEYQKFYLKNSGTAVDQFSIPGGDIESMLDTYVRGDIDYVDRAFLISSLFSPADYFDAEVDETDMFFNIFSKPYEKLELMLGVRYVNLMQTIFQYEEGAQRLIERNEESLEVNDFFPSLSIKYKYDDNNHFDFAFSKTFIIPDLREFSSGVYFHPYDVATVMGNPELVNTNIYNVDLKYSHYFSDSEYIKVGAFYKYLDKPIEDTQLESSSLPIYSYMNSDFATLYGIEIDGRKSLGYFGKTMSKYYVSGNFSFTDSDVTLQEEQEALLTSNHRQLQGLSQTVINATFGYDDEDRSVTLSYNNMGERIRKVGLLDDTGSTIIHYEDTIEIPPQLLDLVWIEKFNSGLSLKLK
ncbi:MAG: carboxypeptidase-like regulatory domain-containing protein, partial [Sulfurovum sp.]|nr:carboxypeptidase-like regulatory domain-containing protein [Sulfurovum sp.]